MARNSISDKDFEYLINLYCSGLSVTAITRDTGVNRNKITRYLKTFGVYEKPFKYTKELIKDFANSKNATVEFPYSKVDARTSLKWTCLEHNYTFANSSSSVMGTRKQWCKLCKGQNIFNIQYFIDFAKEKGGKCISKKYGNYHTALDFKCELGHIFHRDPAGLLDKNDPKWCGVCLKIKQYDEKRVYSLEQVKDYVESKEGKLLSIEKPVMAKSKTKIKCKNNHLITPDVSTLLGSKKSWCKKKGCWSPPHKLSYEFVKKTVKDLGGELISDTYEGAHEPITYKCNRCEKVHDRPFQYLFAENKGVFCPDCDAKNFVNYDIVKKGVEDRGGKLLSKEYISAQSGLKIKCSNGHITDTLRWNSIQNGNWCKDCNTPIGQSLTRVIIEAFFNDNNFKTKYPDWLKYKGNNLELDGFNEELNIAFEYQGIQHYKKVFYQSDEDLRQLKLRDRSKKTKCKNRDVTLIIVKQFKDMSNTELMIQDVKKSILKAGIKPIIDNPKIDFKKIHRFSELNEIRELAKAHGGILLSEVYLGSETKLDFVCKYGHPFSLIPYNLFKRDTWCGHKKCKGERIADWYDKNRYKIIDKLKDYCDEMGYHYIGCDKKGYKNPDGRYELKLFINCGKGHDDFSIRSFQIKRKIKCKDCTRELMTKISEMTIDDLNRYVKKYDGKCLAGRSRGHSIKLVWKCKNGHEWLDTPWQIIANEKWCENC